MTTNLHRLFSKFYLFAISNKPKKFEEFIYFSEFDILIKQKFRNSNIVEAASSFLTIKRELKNASNLYRF